MVKRKVALELTFFAVFLSNVSFGTKVFPFLPLPFSLPPSLPSFFLSLHLCPPRPLLCLISFLCFDFPSCFQLVEEGMPTEELEADLGEHLAPSAATCPLSSTVGGCNLPFPRHGKTGCEQKQTMIHISAGEDEFNMFICLRGFTVCVFYQGPVNVHKSLFVCLNCP